MSHTHTTKMEFVEVGRKEKCEQQRERRREMREWRGKEKGRRKGNVWKWGHQMQITNEWKGRGRGMIRRRMTAKWNNECHWMEMECHKCFFPHYHLPLLYAVIRWRRIKCLVRHENATHETPAACAACQMQNAKHYYQYRDLLMENNLLPTVIIMGLREACYQLTTHVTTIMFGKRKMS